LLRTPNRSADNRKHQPPKEYHNERAHCLLADRRVLSRRILGRCTAAGPCGVDRHVPCGCWCRSVDCGEPKQVGVKHVWDRPKHVGRTDDSQRTRRRPTTPRSTLTAATLPVRVDLRHLKNMQPPTAQDSGGGNEFRNSSSQCGSKACASCRPPFAARARPYSALRISGQAVNGQDELVWRLIPMCRDVVRDAFRRRESAPTVWDEQVGREERPSMLTETTFLTAEIKKRPPRPVCEGLQALEELRVNRPR